MSASTCSSTACRSTRASTVILFALLCGAFFTGMIATFGASFVAEMFKTGQQSNDLEAPMWIVYLAIPLGSGLMCFRFLQVCVVLLLDRRAAAPRRSACRGRRGRRLAGAASAAGRSRDEGRRAQGRARSALILILAPILILAICLAREGRHHRAAAGRCAPPPIFALLIALMLTGIPVSIALGLTVLTFLFTLTAVPIEAVSMKLFTGIESFEIMAIPFFILAGNFLTHGGVARRMINFATSLIGHWHGGLGLAGIVACAMFALVCGSSVATVAAIGAIVLPEMVRHGYPMRFGAGIITVAGSLGILMLPSIPKIIYAVSTNTSIGALFVAGLLPGIAADRRCSASSPGISHASATIRA